MSKPKFQKGGLVGGPRDFELEGKIRSAIEEIQTSRNLHLEIYAAAFLKEVGVEEASKYQLVEKYDAENHTYTWRFERRDEAA